MKNRQSNTDHTPSSETAVVFLDPAPGDVESQIARLARLARWAERQARRLATRPATTVELPPARSSTTHRAS